MQPFQRIATRQLFLIPFVGVNLPVPNAGSEQIQPGALVPHCFRDLRCTLGNEKYGVSVVTATGSQPRIIRIVSIVEVVPGFVHKCVHAAVFTEIVTEIVDIIRDKIRFPRGICHWV